MRVLLVHPSALMYAEIFLRLEPLGLERVAAAARNAGHEVRVVDLQVLRHATLDRELADFAPEAVGVSLNYLANIPEAIRIAHRVKRVVPGCFVFFGGHSISFIAGPVLEQAAGAVDAVVRGEGEPAVAPLLEAVQDGGVAQVPGIVTAEGTGPPPRMMHGLDEPRPARDLMRHRRRYFIGELDPCASIEFTRGCPWGCSFCSAWNFYGRSYRKASPEAAAEEMASIREPNVFIVDDVAFIRPEHGNGIAAELERRNIRRKYYLETRSDVLLRNLEVFERWARLGLRYMFLGMEAIDAEGLDLYRKRVSPDENFHALEAARKLGIDVAINLIVDSAWGTAVAAPVGRPHSAAAPSDSRRARAPGTPGLDPRQGINAKPQSGAFRPSQGRSGHQLASMSYLSATARVRFRPRRLMVHGKDVVSRQLAP